MSKRSIIALFILFYSTSIWTQEKPGYEKKYYVDKKTGGLYWNMELPFYVKLLSSPIDAGITLKSDLQDKKQGPKPSYFDTEGHNTIRTPWAIDPETKEYVYPKQDLVFEIFADGSAPITKSKFFNAPVFNKDGKVFYGKGLKISISTTDKYSGVQELEYSINKENYKDYNDTLSINKEDDFLLQFYAADNVGNIEETNKKTFTVDVSAPETFHSVTGIDLENNIISAKTKIYLDVSDNITGVSGTYYSIDGSSENTYKGGAIPIKQLSNGDHDLEYYSIDNVNNKEKKKTFKFYLDKLAPILSSDVLGDKYVVNEQVYFSGRTKLKLTAVDNKAGVKNVLYSIDNSEFMVYKNPFYLPSEEGFHLIKYYAVDNTENTTSGNEEGFHSKYKEMKHIVKREVYTDLVGPSLNHKFTGKFLPTRDTVFVNKETKINLSATDQASGLQYISYSIDQNLEETKYIEPFSIKDGGFHKIEFFAYDNVNNRNRSSFFCFLDDEPPTIFHTFSIPAIAKKDVETEDEKGNKAKQVFDVYPAYVIIFLAAEDKTVGAENIYYSLNGEPEKLYRDQIKGFVKNKVNILKVISYDKLDNKSEEEIRFYIKD